MSHSRSRPFHKVTKIQSSNYLKIEVYRWRIFECLGAFKATDRSRLRLVLLQFINVDAILIENVSISLADCHNYKMLLSDKSTLTKPANLERQNHKRILQRAFQHFRILV